MQFWHQLLVLPGSGCPALRDPHQGNPLQVEVETARQGSIIVSLTPGQMAIEQGKYWVFPLPLYEATSFSYRPELSLRFAA